MEGTRQQLNQILHEIEAGKSNSNKMSVNQVMETILGRKSEFENTIAVQQSEPLLTQDNTTGNYDVTVTDLGNGAAMSELDEQLKAINQPERWNYHYYRPMPSVGGFIGKFKTFLKKITRKLNRPIVEPLVLDQVEFNGNAVRVMNEMRNGLANVTGCVEQVQNSLQQSRNDVAILMTELSNTKNLMIQMKSQMNTMMKEFEEEQKNFQEMISKTSEDNVYDVLDYGKFEKHFRGATEDIKNRQRIYLPYLCNKHKVIDLGCGRGEFLELLRENNISAEGVDLYEKFVNECHLKGLTVWKTGALEFLEELQDCSVDGIVSFQLVEHLSSKDMVTLCERAYEKLIDGGTLILETPNPTSLAIYTNYFYVDMTHQRPVHPLTLQYILQNAGFSNVEILYTEGSRDEYRIPLLELENCPQIDAYNEAIQKLNDKIWGSQDYAIIATK